MIRPIEKQPCLQVHFFQSQYRDLRLREERLDAEVQIPQTFHKPFFTLGLQAHLHAIA